MVVHVNLRGLKLHVCFESSWLPSVSAETRPAESGCKHSVPFSALEINGESQHVPADSGKVPVLIAWKRVRQGQDMGSVTVLAMAVAATLVPLLARAPEPHAVSGTNSELPQQTVKCQKSAPPPEPVTVSVPSTVVVECPPDHTFDPKVTGSPSDQKVYDTRECTSQKLLTSYCPNATLQTLTDKGERPEVALPAKEVPDGQGANTPGATLTTITIPIVSNAVFYVQCKAPEKPSSVHRDAEQQACVVTVAVEKEPAQGGESGAGGGTAVVHTCRQPNASITVRIPDKGSSVQFACENQFSLYPSNPKKVFKDDCKTEESLKDMTRTHQSAAAPPAAASPAPGPQAPAQQAGAQKAAAGGGGQNVASPSIRYTLRADNKPPKRRLCYLCARQGVTAEDKGTAKDYCKIYVESSARTQCDLRLSLGLVLPCVLAVLSPT